MEMTKWELKARKIQQYTRMSSEHTTNRKYFYFYFQVKESPSHLNIPIPTPTNYFQTPFGDPRNILVVQETIETGWEVGKSVL